MRLYRIADLMILHLCRGMVDLKISILMIGI